MIEIENQKCQLDILDTAGQEEYVPSPPFCSALALKINL